MGSAHSESRGSRISSARKPHGNVDEIFLTQLKPPRRYSRFLSSSANTSLPSSTLEPKMPGENRFLMVRRVYWCSDPLNEAGELRDLSPRTGPRWLALRRPRGLTGPATWEVGHSYVVVDLELKPDAERQTPVIDGAEDGSGDLSNVERYRLNWGRGLKSGTNLTITPHGALPPSRLAGERLERTWSGTCTAEELMTLLGDWDGETYDVHPANNRNCHHFVQNVIQQCTAERAF